MNPFDEKNSVPNYWLSYLIIDREAMCRQVRSENEALYVPEQGKSCLTEILETLAKFNAEGRPIWKPMHMQPIYRMNDFITREGNDGQERMLIGTVVQMWEWTFLIEDCVYRLILQCKREFRALSLKS
jgi:hypothetical protein